MLNGLTGEQDPPEAETTDHYMPNTTFALTVTLYQDFTLKFMFLGSSLCCNSVCLCVRRVFLDCLINPLQEQMEEWKRVANTLDKDHAKGSRTQKHTLTHRPHMKTDLCTSISAVSGTDIFVVKPSFYAFCLLIIVTDLYLKHKNI